ncbi:hypothetical protein SGPA1_10948 [Streptomyces misionensis JCM 4497]
MLRHRFQRLVVLPAPRRRAVLLRSDAQHELSTTAGPLPAGPLPVGRPATSSGAPARPADQNHPHIRPPARGV